MKTDSIDTQCKQKLGMQKTCTLDKEFQYMRYLEALKPTSLRAQQQY